MLSRARQMIRIANFVLNALFWLCLLFLIICGALLAAFALAIHPGVSFLVFVGAFAAAYVLHEKKQKVSGILQTAGGLVGDKDGERQPTRQRVAELLKSLVEEALASAATSFAVVPGVLAVAAVILLLLKYAMASAVLGIVAVVVTAVAACVYRTVLFFALREVDHVVGGLARDAKAGDIADAERQPLVS